MGKHSQNPNTPTLRSRFPASFPAETKRRWLGLNPSQCGWQRAIREQICIHGYIDDAKQEWALECRKQNTDTPSGSDLQPYLGRTAAGSLPACPVDAAQTFATSYDPQSVGAKAVCLILPASHILP